MANSDRMKRYLLGLLLSISVQAKTIHIAVIDSGLPLDHSNLKLCPKGAYDLTNTNIYDTIPHGKIIFNILAEKLKDVDYCVYSIKVYTNRHDVKITTYLKALSLVYLLPEKIDIVNYSSSGTEKPILPWNSIGLEEVLINGLVANGVKFVVAAGNGNKDLDKECNYWPACYENVIPVGNGYNANRKLKTSNYGSMIKHWYPSVFGSSMSAAEYTAELAKKK